MDGQAVSPPSYEEVVASHVEFGHPAAAGFQAQPLCAGQQPQAKPGDAYPPQGQGHLPGGVPTYATPPGVIAGPYPGAYRGAFQSPGGVALVQQPVRTVFIESEIIV